jgi:hypothetical protein
VRDNPVSTPHVNVLISRERITKQQINAMLWKVGVIDALSGQTTTERVYIFFSRLESSVLNPAVQLFSSLQLMILWFECRTVALGQVHGIPKG